MKRFEPGQTHLLPQAIERMIGLEGAPLSDDEVRAQLLEKGRNGEATEFDSILRLAVDSTNEQALTFMTGMKSERLSEWTKSGWLNRKGAAAQPTFSTSSISRHEWSGKYDPFRLIVEHAALSSTKLRGEIVGGRASYVDFDQSGRVACTSGINRKGDHGEFGARGPTLSRTGARRA